MDLEEQSIVEEYASSLEDLTFNSKPLINVLTMLAEENSRYASSVAKLIEERIYKVPQQHKLPALYLIDSIIKNVGGTYLNLIAQVLLKVFVAVFEKADEKTRKDLYRLRHTWPQYFSAKILHDVDVSINKLDPGWPITAVPPQSPSIHVNPKFLKKADGAKPQVPVVVPDLSKENEKEVLLEHQKRLAELQRLQEEQLRLTEQEIQEHQLKRDLILKKQEQERKALMTQQQHVLLTLRLESELGVNSNEKTNLTAVSTKAETTPSTHNITTSRDPRLQRQEQAAHKNNNRLHQQVMKNTELSHNQTLDPRQREQSNGQRVNRNSKVAQSRALPNNTSKRRSRSQSPLNEREKKFQRCDGYAKKKDLRPDPDKQHTGERQPKRQRNFNESENLLQTRKEFQDNHGQFESRGYRSRIERGRGFPRGRVQRGGGLRGNRGREDKGSGDRERGEIESSGREEKDRVRREDLGRPDRGRGRGDRGRGDRGRGVRGRGEGKGRGGVGRGTRELENERYGKPVRDDKGQHPRVPRNREEDIGQNTGHSKPENVNAPQIQFDDIECEKVTNLVKPKPLFSEQEILELQSSDSGSIENDSESAPIPQELSLEHRSVILEEAKRRLDAGHISQEQYIELIDKLCEFYELQRQQELESEPSDDNISDQNVSDKTVNENILGQNANENPGVHGNPGHGPRNQHGRGGRSNRRHWRRRPGEGSRPHWEGPPRKELRIDDTRRRDGAPRSNQASGFEGPQRPSRIVRMDDQQRDFPRVREGRLPLDRPHQSDSGPWRDNERPPHEQGFPSENPGNMIPQRINEMELREPGIDSRHFVEHFPRGEAFHDRGHILSAEVPPLGHKRMVENFQGPPSGPGHDVPPHVRNLQPGRSMQHPMDKSLGMSSHHPEPDQMCASREPIHHGPLTVEPGLHPGYLQDSVIPPAHLRGEPGPHPALHPGDSGLHRVICHGERDINLPPLITRREPDHLTAMHHEEPGLHGQQGLGHLHKDSGITHVHHPGDQPNHPGHPHRYPGHHITDPGPQGIAFGPGQQGNPGIHAQPHLHLSGQGSPQRHGTETPPPSIPSAAPPTPSRMDKKTVNDLFSRLVQVGIIKVAEEPMVNTPPRISTPPVIQQPLVPHPILSHPVSSAVSVQGKTPASQASTLAPINLQKLQEMIEKSREASTVIPIIALNPHDLKKRHSGIISLLYKGKQCSTCGLRFDGEAEAFYREHLDWHFRRNRREKDGRRIAHKQWFIPLKDWLEYEEITDPEEKAHSSFFDAEKPSNDKFTIDTQVGGGSCPVLPTDSEAESLCDICQEKFEQFWEETQEEWHYKEAIRVGGKTYHEMCYQDAKSNVEGTATEAEANLDNSEIEEASQGTVEIKKEDLEVECKDSTSNKQEDKDPPAVKKEDQSIAVKLEGVERSESQCSESGENPKDLSTQSDNTINNEEIKKEVNLVNDEVQVKTEVAESNNSPININEEHKFETEGESIIKSESTDKD